MFKTTEELAEVSRLEEPRKVAYARYAPEKSIVLPLEALFPVAKVQDEGFLHKVTQSFEAQGLLYPLVILKRTQGQWEQDASNDKDMVLAPQDVPPDAYIHSIQCGCNRFYMLKQLGYTSVACVIYEDPEVAYSVCSTVRKDKQWLR